MDHLAILRKSNIKKGDNLLGDILAGRKTIESRWYVNKIAPWDKIKAGETVYFKESGGPVKVKAEVSKVMQFDQLNSKKTEAIIKQYGKSISPSTPIKEFVEWGRRKSNKRYCILVFLTNIKEIRPFYINKTGFGVSSAWLVLDRISTIKISPSN